MALENFKVHVTDVVRFVCYGSTLNRSSMSKVLVIVRAAQVGTLVVSRQLPVETAE